jgi:hypothetical protein
MLAFAEHAVRSDDEVIQAEQTLRAAQRVSLNINMYSGQITINVRCRLEHLDLDEEDPRFGTPEPRTALSVVAVQESVAGYGDWYEYRPAYATGFTGIAKGTIFCKEDLQVMREAGITVTTIFPNAKLDRR